MVTEFIPANIFVVQCWALIPRSTRYMLFPQTVKLLVLLMLTQAQTLKGEEQEERHHQAEETHGLRQGKAQDSIREKLLLQGWVPGIAND